MRIVNDFKYERPQTLKEALVILEKHQGGAVPLAGGTDLVVNMKHRSMLQLFPGAGTPDAKFEATKFVLPPLRPEVVVSLASLSELEGIKINPDSVWIGPTTTMARIAAADELPAALGALRDAAGSMGSPLVRNRATIGGNLVNARPAADGAVALIALGGIVELASVDGTRKEAACDFITAPGCTTCSTAELITGLSVSVGPDQGSAYVRHGTRRQLEIALVGAAAWIQLEKTSGTVKDARICLGAVGPRPMPAPEAAKTLLSKKPDAEAIARCAEAAVKEATPIDDFRGSAGYRSELVGVLVRRALEKAVERAQGAS